MGDALMNWETGRSRWRKKYKNIWLQVSAAELGGTTATDTKLAANQWLKEKKAEIDKELVLKTPRPNELEYRAELENIQSAIKSFQLVMRSNPDSHSMLAPNIELLNHKERLLKQALQQKELPPLDDFLRNPIYVSPESIEGSALQDAKQTLQRMEVPVLYPYETKLIREVNGKKYIVKKLAQLDANGNRKEAMHAVEEVIDKRLNRIVGLKDKMLAGRKRELGLVANESDRGQMIQILKEGGIEAAESRKLDYHIEKFFEAKRQECKLGKIQPGRLKKIICTIDSYRKWSPIINGSVDRIGTKEHIEAYYSFLVQRVLAEEIKPKYAHNLFGDSKMLVFWLVNEEVLKDNPRCLQLKSNKYVFPKVRQKPKIISLPLVCQVLEAANANPRLKLCILLTLNCGFGASEIGKLTKDEYDPKEGRIRHKRCKTEKSDKVPVVCYKLWQETRELLEQEIANRKNYPQRPLAAECLLVNSNGMPLWNDSIDSGKNNNIDSAFKRLIIKLRKNDPDFPPITYYQFRRTSSTLIYNEPRYRIYNGLWLGHAPQTVAEQHYNVNDDTVLDECIAWLYVQIFGTKPASEEEKH